MPEIEAINAEMRRIRQLPRNAAGPIADSYETLQGLIFINQIYAHYLQAGAKCDLPAASAFCSDLISYNVAKLLRRMIAVLNDGAERNPWREIRGPIEWINRLVELSEPVSAVGRGDIAAPARPIQRTPICEELLLEYRTLCASLLARSACAGLRKSIGEGYVGDDVAVIVHHMKLISVSIREHAKDRICNGIVFDDEYYRHVRDMVDSMSGSDNYIDQFRLLHQIPETMSIAAVEDMRDAARNLRSSNGRDALQNLRSADQKLAVIVACLNPLLHLMYPSEYYKMRTNLGGTSGSHSEKIAGELLRKIYFELTSAYQAFAAGHPEGGPVESDVKRAYEQLRRRIYRWRDRHVLFPRNILGTATTSLTGAKNAPDVVRRMSETFSNVDPMRALEGNDDPQALLEPQTDFEVRLLVLTGEATKARFANVEYRLGMFAAGTVPAEH